MYIARIGRGSPCTVQYKEKKKKEEWRCHLAEITGSTFNLFIKQCFSHSSCLTS